MGNAESKQDHYKVLGVHPDATESRITKAFRSEALKWHPVRRTPGDIGEAYGVLSNPKKRAAYDSSRGSGRGGNGKGLIFYTGIFVGGYVMYWLWRSGKLKEIWQVGIEKSGIIIEWAIIVKDSAVSALKTPTAMLAASVEKITLATKNKIFSIVNFGSELKDFRCSAVYFRTATDFGGYFSGLSKVSQWFQN